MCKQLIFLEFTMTMFACASAIAIFAAAGFAQSGFAAANACSQAAQGICLETNNPDIPINCDEGTVVEACPTEGRTATCLFGNESTGMMLRFYPAFPENPKATCDDANGQYIEG
jgi:hypothetical protein